MEEPLLGNERDHSDDADKQVEDDPMLTEYRNLYWTRLIVVDGYEADCERKWPMGPDIVEECQ